MIQYEIIRSARRKTVVIEVHRDQSVKVRAPVRVSEREIDRLVRQKVDWISSQQLRQAQLPQKEDSPRFTPGSRHYFLGKDLGLRWEPGLYRPRLTEDQLLLPLPDQHCEDKAEKQLKDWYRKQAKTYFQQRLDYWFEQMDNWQVSRPQLRLRYMKRYWGSCSSKGIINLNVHLIKVPEHLVDYVITHELSHLKEMNHSPRFYQWQASLLPDWKQRRRELRTWEPRVLV